MPPKLFLQRGDYIYRWASYTDTYFRGEGIVFWVYALLVSKTGKDLPGVESGFTKKVRSIPRGLKLTEEEKLKAKEAIEKDVLWYCKIENKGWRWRDRKGASKVADIHECIYYLQKFSDNENSKSVIKIELINKLV